MKLELEIKKIQTPAEAEQVGIRNEAGAITLPFLRVVLTDKSVEPNVQSCLHSEPLNSPHGLAHRTFWDSLTQILWKHYDPESFPYEYRNGVAYVKSK